MEYWWNAPDRRKQKCSEKKWIAWDRAQASVMRGRGLAASAMARPCNVTLNENTHNCKGNYNYLNLIKNAHTLKSIFISQYFKILVTEMSCKNVKQRCRRI